MGKAIAAVLGDQDDMELVGLWGRGDDLDALVTAADVVIDFSLPDGTAEVLEAVLGRNKPLVSGVSGLNDAQATRLDEVSGHVPLVYDRNMSLGIVVLEQSVRTAAASPMQQFS